MNLQAAVHRSLVVGLFCSFLSGTVCGAENANALLAPAPAVNVSNPDLQAADQRVQASESQLETARKQLSAAKSLLKAAEADLKAAKADRQALSLRQQAEGLAEQAGMGSAPTRQIAAIDHNPVHATAVQAAPQPAAAPTVAPRPDQQIDFRVERQPQGEQSPLIQLR